MGWGTLYLLRKGLTWGFGPVIEFPTGGSKRGTQQWSAGPSFVVLAQPGEWTFGVLINNAWSFAGKPERDNVNHMLLNLFLVLQLGRRLVYKQRTHHYCRLDGRFGRQVGSSFGSRRWKTCHAWWKTTFKPANPVVL